MIALIHRGPPMPGVAVVVVCTPVAAQMQMRQLSPMHWLVITHLEGAADAARFPTFRDPPVQNGCHIADDTMTLFSL